MFTRIRASLVLGALACGALCGQDESRPAQPRPDSTALEKALTTVLDPKGFRLTGDAAQVTPEDESGGGAHIMVMGAGAGAAPFSGGVEIVRTAKGELLIASKSKLPGFAALESGERSVTTTTFESEPIDTSVVVGDLASVLSGDEIMKAAQAATSLTSKTDDATGATRWTFALPKRLARSSGDGPLAFARPRVKALKAAVTIGKDGAVTMIKISVTRTDPMARVKRRAMEQAREGGTTAIGADDMGGDEDGATSVYTLRPAPPAEMSQRAKDALAHLQKALSDG